MATPFDNSNLMCVVVLFGVEKFRFPLQQNAICLLHAPAAARGMPSVVTDTSDI